MPKICQKPNNSDDSIDLIYQDGYLSRKNLENLEEYCVTSINEKWGIVTVPVRNIPEINFETIGYSYMPVIYGLSDLGAVNSAGIAAVRVQPVLSLMGSGIHIVIIDTGINWRHEAFIGADGRSRIELIYDQENNKVYDSFDIDEALRNGGDIPGDEIGHGTFMAGIAAGNIDEDENFSGVAPDSKLIVVKLKQAGSFLRDFYSIKDGAVAYSEADIMEGISFVEKYAEEKGLVLSYCIGVGSNLGSHEGTAPLCDYLEFVAEKAGRCVTVASGNEGIERLHFNGKIMDENNPERVEINVADNENGLTCELWSEAPEIYTVEIVSPTGQIINRIPARNDRTTRLNFVFENTMIYVFYKRFENRSGKNLIVIRFKKPTPGIWTIKVYGSNLTDGRYNVWIMNRDFIQEETGFIKSDPFITICEPANNTSLITPVAYDYINKSAYIRNSRGFNAAGSIKPDFAVPGVNLIGPDNLMQNGYGMRSGSSVAAAFMSGVGALIEEYGIVRNKIPYLRTSDVKNIIIAGCTRQDGINYPSPIWGYGIINVYNSIAELGDEY